MPAPAGLIALGEFRPDVADYEGQHSKNILNVIPRGDGYGPFRDLAVYTTALPSRCMGLFYALRNDGTIAIFAATSTKLYLLNNSNGTWTDVSKGAGTYTPPPVGQLWEFVQFNNFIIAVQQNTVPQVYDLASPSAFADLGGSPPQASYVSIVNRFVVLSGLASPNVYRIQWSGLNSVTTWDNITLQSNFQDLPDGGIVVGVAGGEFGVIFQQRAIRRLTYQPGSAIIFSIDRLAKDDGLVAPYSMINASDRIFFYSEQGFKVLEPGGYPQPIGKERVDRTFAADVDSSRFDLFIGSADPAAQRVYWAYKSVNGSNDLFDTILMYDWVLDRWSKTKIMGEYLTPLSRPGLTLETVDAAYGTGTPVALTSISSSTSAAVFTKASHGLTAGQGILLTTTGALPAPLAINTPYYIKATALSSDTFEVSATGGVGALEGVAATSSSTGQSGTHSYAISSIDMLTIGSLDNISLEDLPAIAAINSAHQAAFFSGLALEATVESAQHGAGLKRIYVRGYKPVSDSASVFGSITYAENLFSSVLTSTEDPIDARGWIWPGVSTRYARARLRIPAGTSWSYIAAVEPDVAVEGQR